MTLELEKRKFEEEKKRSEENRKKEEKMKNQEQKRSIYEIEYNDDLYILKTTETRTLAEFTNAIKSKFRLKENTKVQLHFKRKENFFVLDDIEDLVEEMRIRLTISSQLQSNSKISPSTDTKKNETSNQNKSEVPSFNPFSLDSTSNKQTSSSKTNSSPAFGTPINSTQPPSSNTPQFSTSTTSTSTSKTTPPKFTFSNNPTSTPFGSTATTTTGFGGVSTLSNLPKYTQTSAPEGTSTVYFQSISAMPAYNTKSFEELRLEDYSAGRIGGTQLEGLFGASQTQTNDTSFGSTNQTQTDDTRKFKQAKRRTSRK